MPEPVSPGTPVLTAQPQRQAVPAPPEEPTRRRWWRPGPAFVAVAVWLVATPLAVLAPRAIDFSPFTIRGGFVPIAAGATLLAVATAAAWWRAGERLVAAAAALFAAWVALALQVALNGTPFGFSGLAGDMGRMSAAVTRYTVTPWSSDTFVEGLPSEYPLLYPWLVGRAAVMTGEPAWRVLPLAEIVVTSFAVLAAFLMWRRLVAAPVALVCSGVGLLVFGDARKAFAVVTLFVFVPWLVAAFTSPPRGRLHWLPAGLIGGLIMLTYNGWFPFGVFGILAILVAAWRRAQDRKRYLLHVLGVGVVALVVATPYLLPYGYAVLTKPGQALGDLYQTTEILANAFPFLNPTVLGALQLAGAAGLVWYRSRTWWAWPLLYLVVGSYAFWALMGVRYVLTEHTTLIHYVPRLTGITLASAGVLTLAYAAPALARRLRVLAPPRIGVAATAVAMLFVGVTYWQDWRPSPTLGNLADVIRPADYSTMAHVERLPDCSFPRYTPPGTGLPCLPVDSIRDAVESELGTGARPVTLSYTERLFAFLPWRGYMGIDRTSASSLVRWDDRRAELDRLSYTTDPAAFARESANTAFGPIDVFVLSAADATRWTAIGAVFTPEQFDPTEWTIVDDLDAPVVIAIRNP